MFQMLIKKHRSSLDVGTSILSDQHPSGPICFTWIIKNNYVKKKHSEPKLNQHEKFTPL